MFMDSFNVLGLYNTEKYIWMYQNKWYTGEYIIPHHHLHSWKRIEWGVFLKVTHIPNQWHFHFFSNKLDKSIIYMDSPIAI